MGLGSTAKKIQKLSDVAEKLYANVKDMRKRVVNLEESADETHERVARLERRIERQSAVIEALAEREGIDVEATVEAAGVDPVESGDDEAEGEGAEGDGSDPTPEGSGDEGTAADGGSS